MRRAVVIAYHGPMKLGGILALSAALVLSGCSATPAVDPDIQAKANAFSARVEADMQNRLASEAEAKMVPLSFPKDRPLRLLMTGDSLTGGFFASTKDRGFSKLVQAGLENHGPVEASGGSRAGGTLSTVDSITAVPAGLDLAIVELGTNDVGTKTPPETFAAQYSGLLTKVRAGSPGVAIMCISVWQAAGTIADTYNRLIREKCDAAGGQYVDINSAYSSGANRGPVGVETWTGVSDEFHPNDRGHQAIADLILERVRVS